MEDIDAIRTALDYVPRYIEFQHRYHPYVGTQVAVRVDGALELNQAFGHADLATKAPLTVGHLFRIASHSKTFAAVACMQLVEDGRLRLDDSAGELIPELASSVMAGVTVRELLGHGSGMIRDGVDSSWWALEKPFPDDEELLDLVRGPGKVLERNEAFKYSNIGYSLIGQIVAAASGQPFRDYVRQHIIEPLSLVDTGPDLDMARIDDYASGHTPHALGGDRRVIEHIDTFAESAATGFYSTAAELTDYFQAHLEGDYRLLADVSKRQMRQVQWEAEEKRSYGLGLIVAEVGKRTYYGHSGGYPGHITISRFDPERRLSISVLTNSIDGPAQTICDAVLGLIDLALAEEAETEPVESAALAGFVGRFASIWGVFDMVDLGGRLYMIDPVAGPPPADPVELELVSETELRLVGGTGFGAIREPVTYRFDKEGEVVEVRGPGGLRWMPIERFQLPDRVRRPG